MFAAYTIEYVLDGYPRKNAYAMLISALLDLNLFASSSEVWWQVCAASADTFLFP